MARFDLKDLKLNVRAKLTLLFLAFGLIPALSLFTIFMMQQEDYRNAQMRPTLDAALSVNDVIDRNLFERYGDVQAFGLNTAAITQNNWINPAPDNPLIEAMNGYTTGYGIYKLMLLVDLEGNLLAANTVDAGGNPLDTANLYNKSFGDAPWLKNVLNGEFLEGANGLTGTAVDQPHFDELVAGLYGDDGYVMTFAAPVKDAQGNMVAIWVNFATFDLVEEQGSATQEISRSVQDASSGSAEVSSNISEVNQAAEQAGQAAQSLLGATGELSQQAETLRGEVASFLSKVRSG